MATEAEAAPGGPDAQGAPDGAAASTTDGAAPSAHLPLVLVADVDLPGGATRFDYEDLDTALGHLVIAHMNDGTVLIADLRDGAVLKEVPGIPTARGVIVADDVGRIFATSSPSQLVMIDNKTMTEVGRVGTANAPDVRTLEPSVGSTACDAPPASSSFRLGGQAKRVNPLNVFLRACLSATLLTACGTSSSNDRTASDGGDDAAPATDDAAPASDAAPSCYPFGTPTCGKGQTCCFSGTTGACKDLGACASNIQFECANPGGCNSGEICCTTIPPVSAIDASVLVQDGGLAQLLMGVTATSFCSSTCPSPGFPSCRNSADCAHGAACDQLPEGNIVLVAVGAETLGVCAIGGASVSDGGASESGGSDGAGSDAMGGD